MLLFDDKGNLEIVESRNSCYGHGSEDSNSWDCTDFSFPGFSVALELCPILTFRVGGALGEGGIGSAHTFLCASCEFKIISKENIF